MLLPTKTKMKKIALLSLSLALLSFSAAAQRTRKATAAPSHPTVTAADYERAESRLSYKTNPLIDRNGVRATWLPDGTFWYMVLTPTGREFVHIDPKTGARKSGATPAEIGVEGGMPNMNMFARFAGGGAAIASPDGKLEAFLKEGNLWVRDRESKKETQLTTDAKEDYGYATDNAGWKHSSRPILIWSPDSKKIATFQQDERHVKDMYLVTTNVGAPKLEKWKYPLPGDEKIAMIERVIIDVPSAKVVRLKMPADAHRSTQCDDIACDGGWSDVYWANDSSALAFVSTSRDHKIEDLRVADPDTGAVREVYHEESPTQFESGQGGTSWRYLPESNEFIWYTEHSGWGHLYLYDLKTGKLKNAITSGNWPVWNIEEVDTKNRVIYFNAGGREPGVDPYFSHFYRVNFDGSGLTLLTPEKANHGVAISPDGNYFIDNFSTPNVPTVAVLRDMTGKKVADLEKADVSRLEKTGWKAPTPITVKARDGKTDLYGLIYFPSKIVPGRKYPVVDYIYPGPQGGGVGSRSFVASRNDNSALADLGFVVVTIDGMCNPLRSKAFHDSCYGDMADNTLEDQIAGIKQLAQKYPFMDLDRVGIWGHSGGGFATAAAMFRYPDFFKVGISESGNHDNRNYEDDWGERYIGLLKGDNYEKQANQVYAKNLKGHLLLAHGTMDDNVPPYNTLLVVDALIKANKDFDLILIPNARHGYGQASPYMMRRRWDYFVKNLLGAEPPKNYELKATPDPRTAPPQR